MKEWNFLEAYDYIKAHPELFELCDNPDELSGKHNICVYFTDCDLPISGNYAGSLDWRHGEEQLPKPDIFLQGFLNQAVNGEPFK